MVLLSLAKSCCHMSTDINIYRSNLMNDSERVCQLLLMQLVEICLTDIKSNTPGHQKTLTKHSEGPQKTFTRIFSEIEMILRLPWSQCTFTCCCLYLNGIKMHEVRKREKGLIMALLLHAVKCLN